MRTALALSLTALLITTSTAAELQWRGGRSANKKSIKPAASQRFVRPTVSSQRADAAVRPAAFEDSGPQFTTEPSAEVQLRSIVVDREEQSQWAPAGRSSQLPADAETETETPVVEPMNPPQAKASLVQLRSPFDVAMQAPQNQASSQPGALEADELAIPDSDQERGAAGAMQNPSNQGLPFESTPAPFQPSVPPDELGQPPADDVGTPSAATLDAEREQAETACTENLAKLRARTIDKVSLSIAVLGTEGLDFPFECSLDPNDWHSGRAWPLTTYMWKASALCHKPLYFEDEQLERYGHSWPPCFQPLVSGCHFFTRLPVLPYCMGVEPPNECIYALGHYRPGSCAPYLCNPIPISARGALFQAGAVVGAAAVLP